MDRLIQTVRVDRVEGIPELINKKEKLILCGMGLDECLDRARISKGLMADFDGSLHTRSTWDVLSERLPAELRARDAAIRDWYWEQLHGHSDHQTTLSDPHWFHGRMDPRNQAVVDGAWVANGIQWYIQAGITRSDVRAAASKLGEREGASTLLRMMPQRAVITFGIEQVVQDWLLERKIKAAVAGTRLTFDEEGRLTGHHPNIVASPTKRLAADRFREITGIMDDQILVLGDSIVDMHMMRRAGLNVLLLPPSEADKKLRNFRENNLAAMWHLQPAILVSDSLMPLVNLLMHARL